MATLVCDVNEAAVATDTVTLGFTDIFTTIGRAVTVGLLAVTVMLGTESAVASTTVDLSAGPDLVETATASAEAPNQLLTTQAPASSAKAASWAFYDLLEDVDEVAQATATALDSRSLLLTSQAQALGTALPELGAQLLVTSTAQASSALFGHNELLVVSQGEASSAVELSRRVDALLVAQGDATSAVELDAAREDVLVSSGVASSGTPDSFTAAVTWATSTGVASSQEVLTTLRSAWVMNSESSGMTRYTELPVQSMAVVGGKVLALGDGGLYEFAGDTDAGAAITSSVITGRTTLGSEAVKRLGDMIVSYSATGPMQLRVHVYGGVNQGAYTYAMLPRAADAPRANRIKVGKGLVSKLWQFEWFGVGTRFDVTDVVVDVASSTNRRI